MGTMPPPMGQPITVVEKPSSNPAVLRFETNRPLTGMGHERYTSSPDEMLDKTGPELARRLFAAGGIESVHLNGSVVTVTLSGGRTGAGLGDIVRSLFLHYGDQPAVDGVTPPSDEASRSPEVTADPGTTPAALEAEEPAAADPPAPEAAQSADASATEAGTVPSSADDPARSEAAVEADTSLGPPLDPASDDS
jgi:hypothetical protein